MKKRAFTLIELIFVIVIFGIISMFGADLYTKIYSSYAHARAVNQLEARTMSAISIISSRLEDRIKGTVIARKSNFATPAGERGTFVDIRSASPDHDVLEWIGQSVESKNLVGNAASPGNSVGWSGFADIWSPAGSGDFNLTTQGSNLDETIKVIKRLRNDNTDNTFGIVFRERIIFDDVDNAYGYDFLNGFGNDYVGVATVTNAEVMDIKYPRRSDNNGISEQYHLAHSAYALVPANVVDPYIAPNGTKIVGAFNFNLMLHYNYAPWNSERYDNDGLASVLVKDVSLFRFRNDNGAIALKLCLRDAGRNFDPSELDLIICKSQVVF